MNKRGQVGEQAALNYFVSKGYKLIKQNYICRFGEIDIIMRDRSYIVFVEVRTRKTGSIVNGLESIDRNKIRKITVTASKYLSEHTVELQPRFDVIIMETGNDGGIRVTSHIENAF